MIVRIPYPDGVPPAAFPAILVGSQLTGSDGDPIASWVGTGVTVSQATSGKQPTKQTNEINGKTVARLDAGDSLLGTININTTTLTVFVVARRISSVDNASAVTLYKSGVTNDYDNITSVIPFYEDVGNLLQTYRNGTKSTATHPGNGVAYIVATKFDGTNNTLSLNGVEQAPVASSGSFDINNILIGGRRVGGAETAFSHIDIAEIRLFDTDEDISAGGVYVPELATEYNITI